VSSAAQKPAPGDNPLADSGHRRFLLRKLHSLSGVLPVGAFMVFHLWTNAKALGGQEPFDQAVGEINHMPYLPFLEAGILLPLAFHAIYGVRLALDARPNLGGYAFARNWMYVLQRATGLVALLFLGYHLWEFRLQKGLGQMAPSAFYPTLCAHLSSTAFGVPIVALVYIIGIAASVFHFSNGMWGFCASWGITVSRRSQRISAAAFGLIGVIVFVLGANTTLYFATGSRFFLPSSTSRDAGAQPRSCADVSAAPLAALRLALADRCPREARFAMNATLPLPFVRHAKKPEWGIGALTAEVGPPYRYLFEDGETRAFPAEHLGMLVAVSPDEAAQAALERAMSPAARRKAAQAKAKGDPPAPVGPRPPERAASLERQLEIFLGRFPLGFEDPRFLEEERGVPGGRRAGRMGGVLLAQDELAVEPLRELLLAKHGVGTYALVRKVAQRSRGFLSPEDLLSLSALASDALVEQRFCETLFDLLHGKSSLEERFETFSKVTPAGAATWPLCTLAGALFDPARQLFVHPSISFPQATLQGSPTRGQGRPTGAGYSAMLALARTLGSWLDAAGHRPRDLLDVFIFSSCSLVAPLPRKG
jgi:succinate dehydrogenase / fumarate reductase, cytochrome b subunit